MFLILFCLAILIQCNILCIKTMASLDSVIFHRRLTPNSGSQPKWEQVSLIQQGIQLSQDSLVILFLFHSCSKYLDFHGFQLRSWSVFLNPSFLVKSEIHFWHLSTIRLPKICSEFQWLLAGLLAPRNLTIWLVSQIEKPPTVTPIFFAIQCRHINSCLP